MPPKRWPGPLRRWCPGWKVSLVEKRGICYNCSVKSWAMGYYFEERLMNGAGIKVGPEE